MEEYNSIISLASGILDEKSSRMVLRSIVSKMSLSMVHIANPFNLSYDIVDLK